MDDRVVMVRRRTILEMERIRRSPVYWVENYAWTVDEHIRYGDNERRLFHGEPYIDPLTLLPMRELSGGVDDYLLYVAATWWNHDLTCFPKSRQLRLTHLMVNLHGWLAMMHPGQRIAIQSKKEEDADATLKRFETSLKIMRKKTPFMPWPEVRFKFARALFPNGSIIMAVQQGAAAVRQYTFSAILCVAPGTRVLTDDLRWVEGGTLEVGDGLLGFDEEVSPNRRTWRRASVLSCKRKTRPCYRLAFDDGTEIVCSAEHRWLTGPEQARKWQTTEELRCTKDPGRNANVVRALDVWETDQSYDAGYLAGFFDGEGSVDQGRKTGPNGKSFRVSFGQNPGVALDEAKAALGRLGFEFTIADGSANHREGYELVYVAGRPDMLRFLGQVRPHRLLKNFDPDQIGAMSPVLGGARLIEKEFIGEQEVVALSTSTKTFLAEGLCSHNSDEMAFQYEAEDAYVAAIPTIEGGGKYTAVSSADPGFFQKLCFDKADAS